MKKLLVPAALLLAAIALPSPTTAQEGAKPVPTCAGQTFVDPAGDQVDGTGAAAGPDNADLTEGFFTYSDDGAFANLRIANLTKEVPAGATGVDWYMFWNGKDDLLTYVHASVDSSGTVTYTPGAASATGTLQDSGTTTGTLFEGKDGIVQIRIPAGLAPDGATLKDPYGSVRIGYGAVLRYIPTADDGPDSQIGAPYTVGPCTTGAGTAPTPAPAATPPAATGPTPAADLGVTLAKGSVKLKKNAKGLTVALKGKGTVKNLGARLLKGSGKKAKAVATGKLATLGAKGSLKLKGKSKLKKGTYALELNGTIADGRRATVVLRLKLS